MELGLPHPPVNIHPNELMRGQGILDPSTTRRAILTGKGHPAFEGGPTTLHPIPGVQTRSRAAGALRVPPTTAVSFVNVGFEKNGKSERLVLTLFIIFSWNGGDRDFVSLLLDASRRTSGHRLHCRGRAGGTFVFSSGRVMKFVEKTI